VTSSTGRARASASTSLGTLPLGPNLVGVVGHSTIRSNVWSLAAARTRRSPRATMRSLRWAALWTTASMPGYSGGRPISPLEQDGRPRFRSRPTRSLFANFAEYRAYTATVNRRDAVFRAIPHIQTGWTTAPLIDPFLDLRVDYGNDLRCYRVVGNADPEHLE
jgi:N-acyl-D-aspartate/D-glutamate deacylase